VATKQAGARIELSIPGRPEYVGVARLAILGVASRMRFSYDEVEDIRLAVGEACTTAIERANGLLPSGQTIHVRCLIDSDRLVVEVQDEVPARESEKLPLSDGPLDERNLGSVLIRILMDDVEIVHDTETGGRVVRMIKYVDNAER
jgi:serine/threonine-protein kinase RsbW